MTKPSQTGQFVASQITTHLWLFTIDYTMLLFSRIVHICYYKVAVVKTFLYTSAQKCLGESWHSGEVVSVTVKLYILITQMPHQTLLNY